MLQEVTAVTWKVFTAKLNTKYHMDLSAFSDDDEGYFTAILVKKDIAVMQSSSYQPFTSSAMGRGLQIVEAKIHDVPMTIMTSHLESMKDMANERQRQFKLTLSTAKESDIARVVFVGGDFNLRDKEIPLAGGIPKGFYDCWEQAGSRPEAKHTWDLQRNTNKQIPGRFQPRCRFDRLYYRSADDIKVTPVYFELVGLEKSTPLRRFPSDHWGILFHADLTNSTNPVA